MVVSPVEGLILDLLSARGSAYGLELVTSSNGRLKRGSIYVTLGRMERKGLVTSRLEGEPGVGPPRRVYEPTRQGLRALVVWGLVSEAPLRVRP
ncbi:MAG TPA: PadR family transcriptional regulator [Vicinamibacterales bacterium]